MKINPYEAPKPSGSLATNSNVVSASDLEVRGPRCVCCGSFNTTKDSILRAFPSILAIMFFGWVFILVRIAFGKRASSCRDCGEITRYKTVGSWVVLVVLVVLVLLVGSAFL